jgi:hypothetical protein
VQHYGGCASETTAPHQKPQETAHKEPELARGAPTGDCSSSLFSSFGAFFDMVTASASPFNGLPWFMTNASFY